VSKPLVVAVLAVCAIASIAAADEKPDRGTFKTRPGSTTQYQVPKAQAEGEAAQSGRPHMAPNYAAVQQPQLMRYRSESDYPDYNRGFNGSGLAVAENGIARRSDWAIGIQTGTIRGGGCFPSNVNDDSSPCLTEAVAGGGTRTIYKERERWIFRISYIDPSVSNAAERNIGFPGIFAGLEGDDMLDYVRTTERGHSCFGFYIYYCDTYGIDLDYITGSVRAFKPDCTMKTAAGYKAQIFYQFSRYKSTDTIPPGATEWEPATIPATTTRLEQPGRVIWTRNFQLGVGENALSISGAGIVNPSVESNTAYNTVAPTIAAGTSTVTVSSFDCVAIPNVAFTITRELLDKAGHDHVAANDPPLDEVNSLASYSGTTDSTGRWTTTLTAGRIAGSNSYKATAPNLLGQPFTTSAYVATTGFTGMIDPGVGTLDTDIRYTGNTEGSGLNHPGNHYGSPELHQFVREMATMYQIEADPADRGSLGLNDMSIILGGLFDIDGNWSPSHFRHRFGTDCDIDRRVLGPSGLVFLDQDTLQNIVEMNLDGIFLHEGGNRMHVQVPEYMVGDILLREAR